jgi:lactate dehydrogenase-like 2-hydroxyacid dehydrogenase
MHHKIVSLEKQHQPLPADGFAFPASTTYTVSAFTTASSRDELHDRIRNATIAIVTVGTIDAQTLHPDVTPDLKLIVVGATGTDAIDLEAAKKRGIRVVNCPAANVNAVSEHALSLYFAARRRTALLDRKTREQPSEWKTTGFLNKYMRLPDGQMPLTCSDEVLGIIGYGGIGR